MSLDYAEVLNDRNRFRELIARLEAENRTLRKQRDMLYGEAGSLLAAVRDLKRYEDPCVYCGQQGQSIDSHGPRCPITISNLRLTSLSN